jgi:hypothetical protein
VRVDQLTRWGKAAAESEQTQKSLMKLWNVTQGAVSNAVSYLVRQAYVVALPRTGTGATRYVLSGLSRIIFG